MRISLFLEYPFGDSVLAALLWYSTNQKCLAPAARPCRVRGAPQAFRERVSTFSNCSIGWCKALSFPIMIAGTPHPLYPRLRRFTNNIPADFSVSAAQKVVESGFPDHYRLFGSECMSVFDSCGFDFQTPTGLWLPASGSSTVSKQSSLLWNFPNPSGRGIPYPRAI